MKLIKLISPLTLVALLLAAQNADAFQLSRVVTQYDGYDNVISESRCDINPDSVGFKEVNGKLYVSYNPAAYTSADEFEAKAAKVEGIKEELKKYPLTIEITRWWANAKGKSPTLIRVSTRAQNVKDSFVQKDESAAGKQLADALGDVCLGQRGR